MTTPNLPRVLWYVAIDIKVVHTGLAAPKGHIKKQIGKNYVKSCFLLNFPGATVSVVALMVLHDQFHSQTSMQNTGGEMNELKHS